jgi:hypothetical protein
MQETHSFFWVDQTLTVPGDFLEFLRDNVERFYRREKKKLRTGIARLASRER